MDRMCFFLFFCFLISVPFLTRAQDFELPQFLTIPGTVEGKGKHFEVRDSEYLNIVLESTEEIDIILESIPRMISLNIGNSSTSISTQLTLSGLKQNKTYYEYQDTYKNEVVFISDESGKYTWEQDLTQPHYIWIQEVKGTIFIPRDCSIYGIWETSTQTCTLNQDVTSTIEITVSNITLDCAGHWIKNEYWISGPILSQGIYLGNKTGVTIKNCNITGFDSGILLYSSKGNEITGNQISKTYGRALYIGSFSNGNGIIGNKISDNVRQGIVILYSNNNRLRGNQLENSGSHFGVVDTKIEGHIQDIDTSNLINGKPIYYLIGRENETIEAKNNPGYIGVINSKNITITNVSLSEGNYQQVLFVNSQNSKIENSQILNGSVAGIQLLFSSNIEILKNNISNCGYAIYASTIIGAEGTTLENGLISENNIVENGGGIELIKAFGNQILKNNISRNNFGLSLGGSFSNLISENQILNNNYSSIDLVLSSNNTLIKNIISDSNDGIILSGALDNNITENSISKTWRWGIYVTGIYTSGGLVNSKNNKIYHNNFINNKENANSFYSPENSWDNGYPSGGNYWSDYDASEEGCIDVNKDGFCDAPYTFSGGQDNYPFIKESGWMELPPPEPEKWSFAIITDLHIGRGYSDYDSSGFVDSDEGEDYYLTERLKNVVQWIIDNKDDIDCDGIKCPIQFLTVLGDIADSAEKSEFLKARKILDRLNDFGIPYVPVFGNHDVWPYTDDVEATSTLGEDYFEEIFWSENATNTKLMEEILKIGRDNANQKYKNFAFSFDGINFIALDFVERTESPEKGVIPSAEISNETEFWFIQYLQENRPAILFSHHPFIMNPIFAFEVGEMSNLDETIKISKANVLADFAGHVHSFEELWGRWPENANIEYPAGVHWYTPANIPVVTTEALMVGSNEQESKGIIRVVKVLNEDKIEYDNWETTLTDTEFVALNPQFEWYISKVSPTNEPLEYTFISQPFTKREISSFEWDFGSWLGKKFGKTITILKDKLKEAIDLGILEKIGLNKVKLPVKLTLTDQKTQQSEYLPRDEIINLGYAYSLLLPTTDQAISLKTGEKLTVENRGGVIVQIDDIRSELKPVGLLKINFDQTTGNINLTDLVAQTDSERRKSILYTPAWPNEIEVSKILFIPK